MKFFRVPCFSSGIVLQLAALCFIGVISTVAYSNSFQGVLTFDDRHNIIENYYLKIDSLSPVDLIAAATQGPSGHRWVPNFSFALNYYFHKLDVWGYHLVNLVVHIVTACGLYLLAQRILLLPVLASRYGRRAAEVAFVAAVLWAVHPVQTNAVTYIVQRMTSMAAMFYVYSLLFYVVGRRRKQASTRFAFYLSSLLCGVLAVFSKENAVTLPLAILAIEVFFMRQAAWSWGDKKHIVYLVLAGCALLVPVWFFLGINPVSPIMAGYEARSFTLGERLLTEARVLLHYLSLLALPLPSRLNLNYDFPLSTGLFSPPQTVGALLVLGSLWWAVLYLFKRDRLLSFAILWFLGNLVIESSFIALELVFEHRLYLPSMFVSLAFIALLYRLAAERRYIVRGTVVVVGVIFVLLTWQRNELWGDQVRLWTDVVAKSPQLARAHYGLGVSYQEAGDYQAAEESLLKAVALAPEDSTVYFNLAILYEKQNNFEAAIKALRTALVKKNAFIDMVYAGLSRVYRKAGDYPRAMQAVDLALKYGPGNPEALLSKGIVLEALGRHAEAMTVYQRAFDSGLRSADFYNNWGMTCYSLGLLDQAVAYFKVALEFDPDHKETHYNLGIAYGNMGLLEKARQEMRLGM